MASSPPRVLLLGSGDRRPKIKEALRTLRPQIEKQAKIVLEDFAYQADLSKVEADFAIVLGGDGSILRAARQMGEQQIPVLGVNLGKLGFLADIHPDFLEQALASVIQGKSRTIDHLMMRCEVIKDGETVSDVIALNEAAILGGPSYEIQCINLFVDDEKATSYLCDGLIISTPIGSTAHNLSAGGPILRKDLAAFVISPISPHTLSVRPVVDTAERIYEVVVSKANSSTSIVIDGQNYGGLTPNDRVRIQRAKPIFQLIQVTGNSYYHTLREKLGWSGQFFK